ncbi:MAG: hypothetical protein K5840_00945, partial [Eubacterium sp.]|nr:hypothetical protein [Eubacterium sp.]
MNGNFGKQLQKTANIVMGIIIACSVISGIAVIAMGKAVADMQTQLNSLQSMYGGVNSTSSGASMALYVILGLLVIAAGSFMGYVCKLALLCFGRITENTDFIAHKMAVTSQPVPGRANVGAAAAGAPTPKAAPQQAPAQEAAP